jgi:hypothetical protein
MRVTDLLILEHECPAFENHEGWGNRFVVPHEAAKLGQPDDEGNFNLGVVRRGNYRLLLSNSRAFRQPETLTCWGKKCTLETILVVNPTDEPTTNCPIR